MYFFKKVLLIYFCALLLICYAKEQNIVLIIADDVIEFSIYSKEKIRYDHKKVISAVFESGGKLETLLITSPFKTINNFNPQGWNDASFHGSNEFPTPNIDALAYNGIILNRFYTQTSCSPSRTALLTGKYPIRLGFQGIPIIAGENRHLPFDIDTLPKKLGDLGYNNYLVGKWHLGGAFKNVTPTGLGFDYHFGYWNGYIGYKNHYAQGKNFSGEGILLEGLDMHKNFEPMWATQGQYATDLFTQQAEQIILNQNIEKPFFLTIAHLAGHSGYSDRLEVPDENENNIQFNYIKDPNRRLYAGMVTELDKSVGKILKALKEKNVLDNTLVVFISDNGAQTQGLHENYGSNWPLRGLKFSVHEGGIRNLAVMYSSQLKNKGVNNELMHISDLMPTLYAAAGGDSKTLGQIDGVNQWDNLINNRQSGRSNLLINIDEVYNSAGLIGQNGRFKIINGSTIISDSYDRYYGDSGRKLSDPQYNTSLVLNSDVNIAIAGDLTDTQIQLLRQKADIGNCRPVFGTPERCTPNKFCLFDLHRDPCERNNVAAIYPFILNNLKKQLSNFWTQLVPQALAPVDLRANPANCNNTWFTWLDQDNSIEHC